MNSTKLDGKKGFTLVELSIVLVIIGLLIGGILAGQSMITTAKIGAFVRQVQQYDIAMENFHSRYNGLPGDNKIFNTVGDDNGTIDNNAGITFDDTAEIGHVWTDLQVGVSINDGNTYVTRAAGAGPLAVGGRAAHIPASKIGGNGTGIMVMPDISGQNIFNNQGFYLVAGLDQNGGQQLNMGGTSAKYSIPYPDAVAIDLKIDDGVYNTGSVNAYNDLSFGGYTPTATYMLMIKYLASAR